jgi:hypothetical protein
VVLVLTSLLFLQGSNSEGDREVALVMSFLCALFSLLFSTKKERKEKKEARKREEETRKRKEEARRREEEAQKLALKRAEEAEDRARKSPGCHSMDNVDILFFSSSNNLFTVGNNPISLKIRNKNSYGVMVTIRFKYSDTEGWSRRTLTYEIAGNEIKTIYAHGEPWRKAKDVTIMAVH